MTSRNVSSILFVTFHFPPEVGGIQTRITNYLAELSRRGIMSTVIIVESPIRGAKGPVSELPPFISPNKVKLVRCEGGTRGLFLTAAKVLNLIGSGKSDVIHVFTGSTTVIGVFTLLTGRLLGHPTSMSIFGKEDLSQTTRLGGILLVLAGTFATTISTNSVSTGTLLPSNFRRKSRVLLGGYSPLETKGDIASERKSVLFVGRLVKRKGVDDLLKAFKVVKAMVPETTLTIVGDGPERRSLSELASTLGLAGSVEFKGTLVGSPLAREYQRCSLCVLPSKLVADDTATEGLGLALVEASMYGKPLVGTDHGGITEVIRNGENGIVVPQGNPERLSQALLRLLTDDALAQKMGEASLKIAKSQFTLEAATDRLLESYAT